MRTVKLVLLILGIGAIAFSIHRIGWAPVLAALEQLAWWQLVLVCLPYAVITAVDTLGWRFAFPRDAAPFRRLFGARLAGEALNLVTAVGSVGGEVAKAWLIRRDVAYAESVPSVVIAKTTLTIAQALFLLIGVALAWTCSPSPRGCSAPCSGSSWSRWRRSRASWRSRSWAWSGGLAACSNGSAW